MAPSWFQTILDVALAASGSGRKKVRQQGIARTHLPHGCRELNLGCAPYPWQIEYAWLRYFGEDCARWMRKAPRSPEPAKRWAAFLSNHREVIAAMDFFTVPTLTFGVLYCFFFIAHNQRRILQCSVTKTPDQRLGHSTIARGIPFRLCAWLPDL